MATVKECLQNVQQDGYQYVQPCRPTSYKPIAQMQISNEPFVDHSVYKCSYYASDRQNHRPQPIKHQDQTLPTGEFEKDTVHKLSYPVQCAPVVQRIVPRDHCIGGTGPMRLLTTQQHDYYTPCNKRENIIQPPKDHLELPCGTMAKLTTTGCSYQPVCVDPAKNFKPVVCYTAPVDEMDLNTVHRSSYKDVGPVEKIETPWDVKLAYCKPETSVEKCTVYNYSYKEPGGYVKKDNCGNTLDMATFCNLAENCCPFTCLADQAEKKWETTNVKAHQYDS